MSDQLEIDLEEVGAALEELGNNAELRAAFVRIAKASRAAQGLAGAAICPGGMVWVIRGSQGRVDALTRCEQAARDVRNYRHGTTGAMELVPLEDGVGQLMEVRK